MNIKKRREEMQFLRRNTLFEENYIYFVMDYVVGLSITNVFFIIFLILVGLWYVVFCTYLTLDMIVTMTGSSSFISSPLLRSMFSGSYSLHSNPEDQESDTSPVLSDN